MWEGEENAAHQSRFSQLSWGSQYRLCSPYATTSTGMAGWRALLIRGALQAFRTCLRFLHLPLASMTEMLKSEPAECCPSVFFHSAASLSLVAIFLGNPRMSILERTQEGTVCSASRMSTFCYWSGKTSEFGMMGAPPCV